MKPISLTMQAFGAYADKQVIDFTLLGSNNFFLIHGPTGSGKTTILDAISFALYGTASGDLRETKSLRSDYADPSCQTEVTFKFLANKKVYEVTRTPEQTILKKRGEGTRVSPSGASICEILSNDEKILLGKTSNATTKIVEDIIGFKADQFSQIVLLPQGEFRKFLIADSTDRQKILETLFKTILYRKIEESLKAKSKLLESSYTDLRNRKNAKLETAGFESLELLKEKIALLKEELKTDLANKNILQTKYELNKLNLEKAKNTVLLFEEKKAATENYQQLEVKKDSFELKKSELEKAEQALAVIPYFESCSKAFKKLSTASNNEKVALDNYKAKKAALDNLKSTVLTEFKKTTFTDIEALPSDFITIIGDKITETSLEKAKLEDIKVEIKNSEQINMALKKCLANLSQVEKNLEKAKNEQKITETSLKETRQKYIDNLASELAKDLTEGAPCPVCGSCHHPNLNKSGNNETIDVEAAEKANEVALNALTKAEHAHFDAKSKLEAKNSEVNENKLKITKKCQELNLDPKLCENLGQIANLIVEKSALIEKLKKWQKDYQNYETALTEAKSSFNNSTKYKTEFELEFEESTTILKTKFIENGFGSDIQIAQKSFIAAKKSKDELDELKQNISTFENNLASAKDRLKRANKAVENLILPELSKLEEIEKETSIILQNARENYVLKEKDCQTKEALALEIEKVNLALTKVEAKYNTASSLVKAASGNNSENITFSSFVLQTILSDVLKTANSRLSIMSRGRYHLNRTSEVYDGRKKSGLNIEITDSFTGVARPVKTLSGGEIFLASLSLALGLSDVVQSYAGGVKLDTILVDEGFGSLDSESLDSAIQTLIDLQKSGRLVGIISHVAELRERIPVRLEITPTKRGSIAKFHV